MRDAVWAAYHPAMAESAASFVELEPDQPAAVRGAVAGLLAGDLSVRTLTWWRAGIADALAGGAGPAQSGVGAAPLRKSRGTDRP
jgi:hypothetical protein